jgi:hypothetical protein
MDRLKDPRPACPNDYESHCQLGESVAAGQLLILPSASDGSSFAGPLSLERIDTMVG